MRITLVKYIFSLIIFSTIAGETSKCQDTTQIASDTVSIMVKHSPVKAAFLSAVVPGLGQIYNGKGLFWRLPILYAGLATEAVLIYYLNNQYQKYHSGYVNYNNYTYALSLNGNYNLYDTVKVTNMLSGLGISSYYISEGYAEISSILGYLKYNNDNFERYRDLNVIFMAGIYFLNIIDATVQAYFFDYNINDNLSLRVQPTLMHNSLANFGTFGMKLTFNLH